MILFGIRTLLLANPSIVSLIPAQTIKRISVPAVFCNSAQQGFVPPFVVLSDVGEDPNLYLADAVSGFRTLELDVDVYGYDSETTRTTATAIRQYLDDFHGTAGDYTVKAFLWQNAAYNYVRLNEGRDTRAHIATHTFLVQYE